MSASVYVMAMFMDDFGNAVFPGRMPLELFKARCNFYRSA
jgi:hypothetical protein